MMARVRFTVDKSQKDDDEPIVEVTLKDGRSWRRVPSSDVGAGAVVRVGPGDRVPLDGRIVRGATALDQSMVTGEGMPATPRASSVACLSAFRILTPQKTVRTCPEKKAKIFERPVRKAVRTNVLV